MNNTTTSRRPRRMARQPKSEATPAKETAPAARKPSKTDLVISLLKRKNGVTLDELVNATGWLPHSARAALTGLRKDGHTIERTKPDGVSRYAIVEPVSQ